MIELGILDRVEYLFQIALQHQTEKKIECCAQYKLDILLETEVQTK